MVAVRDRRHRFRCAFPCRDPCSHVQQGTPGFVDGFNPRGHGIDRKINFIDLDADERFGGSLIHRFKSAKFEPAVNRSRSIGPRKSGPLLTPVLPLTALRRASQIPQAFDQAKRIFGRQKNANPCLIMGNFDTLLLEVRQHPIRFTKRTGRPDSAVSWSLRIPSRLKNGSNPCRRPLVRQSAPALAR